MMEEENEDSFEIRRPKSKSKKRQSLAPPPQNADFDSDIEDEESTIDMNKSRNLKRRSMILEKLQQTKKDRTRNETRSDLSTVMKTEEEAAAEYKNTMELFMKNKINEKNVYKLNLNLAATLYKKSNEKKVDFAEAATALDGATKIWCYKVDAIYTEACQITKDLVDAKETEADPNDSNSGDSQDISSKKKQTKKKRLKLLYEDPAPITNKKVDQLKDPYALEVASKLDSATDISKLRMENQQLETTNDLKLVPNESSSRIKNSQREPDKNLPVFNYELFDNVLNFGEELLVEINHNSNYASSFDKNLEDKLKTPAAPAAQSQSQRPEFETDSIIFEAPDINDFGDESENFEPANELICPPSIDPEKLFEDLSEELASDIMPPPTPTIPMTPLPKMDFAQVAVETENLDDSILDKIFERRDSHRFRVPRIPPKIKAIMKKKEALAQGKEPSQKKIRVSKKIAEKKTPEKKTIFTNFESQVQGILDFSIFNLKQKTKIKLEESEAGFMKNPGIVLPLSRKTKFLHFSLRPSIAFKKISKAGDVENEVGELDLDQEEEEAISDEFMPAPIDYDNDDAPLEDFGAVFDSQDEEENPTVLPEDILPKPTFGDDNLLQRKTVEKLFINFDRRPRRVNVRRVKGQMKNLIEADVNNTKSRLESSFVEEEPVYDFSKLRNELDDCLDGDDRKNLTTSMSLVCLLYLANEQGLELVQEDGNFKDFTIKTAIE